MSFENFKVDEIELDEADLGIGTDVTSKFNPENKKNVLNPEPEDEFEVDLGDDGKEKELEKPKEDSKLLEVVAEEDKKPEDKVKEKPKKVEVKKEDPLEEVDKPQLFKQITDYLITEGIFDDFEDKDKIEYNEDTFKDLIKEQAISKAKEEYDKLTSELSEDQLSLIDFFKKGGNLSQLASYQKDIEDYTEADASNPDIAEELIRVNYLNKGKSEKWVKSYIETLRDKGEDALKEEGEESKSELLKDSELEKENYKKAVIQAEEKRQFEIEQFNQGIKKNVNSDSALTPQEQKKLVDFLSLNKKLKNGNIVNDLQIKLYEVQNTPKDYVELGKFLQDIGGYKNKVQKDADKKAVLKTFNVLKQKASITSTSASVPNTSSNVNKAKSPFDFN